MTAPGAALALLLAASPFTAEHPTVREGNEKLRAGDAAAALERYGRAEAEAGAHPEIDFDRGDALYAQGQGEAARQAWAKAAEAARTGPLASRALQNGGNALDAAGDREGAARAFTEALRRDPGNEDARYNLEVLLRRKAAEQERKKQEGQQGKQEKKQEKQQDQGQQGKPEGQDEKQEKKPGQPPEQDQKDGQHDRQADGQNGPGAPPRQPGGRPPAGGSGAEGDERDGREAGGARTEAIGKQDAERLLDAMRARERSVPLHAAPRKDARRRDVQKDW